MHNIMSVVACCTTDLKKYFKYFLFIVEGNLYRKQKKIS
jgi:hypothetical protein